MRYKVCLVQVDRSEVLVNIDILARDRHEYKIVLLLRFTVTDVEHLHRHLDHLTALRVLDFPPYHTTFLLQKLDRLIL